MAKKKLAEGKHLLAGSIIFLALAGLAGLTWHWQTHLICRRIEWVGLSNASADTLLALARVDTGTVLFHIDPPIVEDRVIRHPWVREADASRFPTGTLRIRVRERTPVALAVDPSGHLAYYLDRDGFRMPLVDGVAYDVPLVRGIGEPYHPVRPVQDPTIRALAGALGGLSPRLDALVSDVALRDGEVWLFVPDPAGDSVIDVRLGRRDLDDRLRRLDAFWQQAVLARPDQAFRRIDLRFDSRIVTEQDSLQAPPPGAAQPSPGPRPE